MIRSVLLEILAVVRVISLAIDRVFPWFEIGCAMLHLLLFFILTDGPLFLLDEVFVVGCGLHVSVFECALIGSPSSISRSYLIMQPRREVVHLEREMAHSIHLVSLLGVRYLGPDQLWLPFSR